MRTFDVAKVLGNNILTSQTGGNIFYDWMYVNKIKPEDTLDFSNVEEMTTASLVKSLGRYYVDFKIEPQVKYKKPIFEHKIYHCTWAAKNNEMWDKILEEATK